MNIPFTKKIAQVAFAAIATLFLASCENPLLVEATGLYTVKFETNCPTQIDSYRTNKIEKIQILEKQDAQFIGWYTNASFSGSAVSFPYELSSDTTFYAKWNQKYTVRFETNGGTEIASYKTASIAESPDTSKSGYYFAGWYESQDFGGDAVSFPYQLTHATTLYAKWLKIYTVNFETNGGTEITPYQCAVVEKSPETQKEGFKFAGWFKESVLQNLVSFPYTLQADTTLYAKWIDAQTSIYKVEHYLQNTDIKTYSLIQTEQQYGEAGKQTAATAKTYDGFVAQSFAQAVIAEDDTTVIRIYYDRNAYTVTFNPNGGVGNIVTQTYYYGAAQALSKNTYTKPGYSFLGWATTADGNADYADGAQFTTENDVTLYAIWGAAPVQYTVKHYKQNKSLNGYELTESETLTAETGTSSSAVAKAYTGFVAKPITQETVVGRGSTTVSVYYDREAYTLSFKANGGNGKMTAQTFYYEVPQKIKENSFVKSECSFSGWATSSDGKKIYADGDSITLSADKTLYATWFYGVEVSATTISDLDVSAVSGAYTIAVTGAITQSTLVALAEKIANAGASADITLDLSGTTGLVSISSAGNSSSIFKNCNIPFSIILPETVTTIAACAFIDCSSLYDINFPASLKTIGGGAFNNTNLKQVVIDGVETIGRSFVHCSSLESIEIKNVSSIDVEAFYNCSQLKLVRIENVQTIGSNAFGYCSSLQTVYLSNIDEVGEYAFGDSYLYTSKENVCYSLKNAYLSDIRIIGNYAFANCYSLEKAKLINISTIGEYAFYGCTKLDSVYLENIDTIKTRGFSGCTKLATISIDAITIEKGAFAGCRTLSAVTIGSAVTSIENYYDFSETTYYTGLELVFASCNNLTSVKFENTENWYYTRTDPRYTTQEFSLDVSVASTNASMLTNSNSGSKAFYKWYKK